MERLTLIWQDWKLSLLSGGFLVVVLLLLWNINAFAQLNLTLSNAYFIPTQTTDSIIIIAIDDTSLAEYGRTPAEWSRNLYGELAEIVAESGARVLAYDLIFSEPSPDDEIFATALTTARQSDARTRIVLSGAGVQTPTKMLLADGFSNGLHYTDALDPTSLLRDVSDYIGYVNAFPDVDGRLRRQPSVIEIDNELQFSFSLAVFMAHRRIPSNAIEQLIEANDSQLILSEDLVLPVDEGGLWLQNYFGAPYVPETKGAFTVVTFRDVIERNINEDLLADKIILVGLIDSLGATDQYLVPSSTSGALMSGVEIQAHAIETLLSNLPIALQSRLSQAVMIIVLTLSTSILFNKPRWYWKLCLWLAVVLAFFVVTFYIFTTQRLMTNLLYGTTAISLPALVTIGLEISREISRRRRSEFLLQSVVAVSEQNMVIDNILPLIARDVQQIVQDVAGFIWVYSPDGSSTPKEYRWRMPVAESDLRDIANHSIESQTPVIRDGRLAIPIIWQGHILGLIALQSNRIGQSQITLLQDLAQRLAPSLDNIALHRSLDQQNRLLESILRSSPASIVVLDHAHKILRSNHRFGLWLGIEDSKETYETEFIPLLRQHEIPDEMLDNLDEILEKGGPFEFQLRDKYQRVLRLSAVPLTQVGHWVLILVDVTDLVQLNELKTQMIRMASHDLKNPLARILGYAEIITMGDTLDETNQKFMKNIMNAGDEINQIITDILDLEHLRSREIDKKPISFKNLVREMVSRHEPDKDRKQQTVMLDMLDAPITVNADHMRLGQAVSNLLSNAIKYTPDEGEINIRIHQPEPSSVQLEIQDNGYGIPQDAQARLFTEFYRVKSKETRRISGTGLGLSLVKSVIEAHDGQVWVESVEGEGSTFYVSLPISSNVLGE